MATYYCKCGRVVQKSTNADVTGNRNTEDCKGCPYLIPWGPNRYSPERGAWQEVKGYECRMSRQIKYGTYLVGSWNDKLTMRLRSLDLDFLQRVSKWIKSACPDHELSLSFDFQNLCSSDFDSSGLIAVTITCEANKRGVAAKHKLQEAFFNPIEKTRIDMTPDEEKAKILADIEKGKTSAQNKEILMKETVYKDAKGILYKVGEIGELGNADRTKLTIKTLGIAPGSGWRKKPMSPEWSVINRKDAQDGLDEMAAQNGWTLASDEEIQYNQLERAALLDDDTEKMNSFLQHENPTSSAAAIAADKQIAENLEPAALTPTIETAANTSEQVGDAPTPVPASEGMPTVFDYSGLDEQTVNVMHMAETEIKQARQGYIIRVSAAVAAVHEELVGISDKRSNQYSDATFTAWCAYVSIKRDAAYRFLQVNQLLTDTTPEEAAQLEQASPSLLYAAAKPSAPAELVQAVKDGDITTHKQYQEAMAHIKQIEHDAELDRKERDAAYAAADRYKAECDRRAQEQQRLEGLVETANQKADLATRKSSEAWEKVNMEQGARKKAEKERDEAANARDGARQALQAAKMRGDKYKAELEALKSQPIEASVVDYDEVERLAQVKADAITSRMSEEHQDRLNDIYDQVILSLRAMASNWTITINAYSNLPAEMRKNLDDKIHDFASKVKEDIQCL